MARCLLGLLVAASRLGRVGAHHSLPTKRLGGRLEMLLGVDVACLSGQLTRLFWRHHDVELITHFNNCVCLSVSVGRSWLVEVGYGASPT